MARAGMKIATVRLSPSVHGSGDHGFARMLADMAVQNGEAAYANEGQNRWCAVHRQDAARLYRLVLERSEGGVRYHDVAEEAQKYFDWFHFMSASDSPASSAWTREVLGWSPSELSLIVDINAGLYRPTET